LELVVGIIIGVILERSFGIFLKVKALIAKNVK